MTYVPCWGLHKWRWTDSTEKLPEYKYSTVLGEDGQEHKIKEWAYGPMTYRGKQVCTNCGKMRTKIYTLEP